MARKIVITSGKGGVGKTTLCASLGAKLSLGGQRVLLVDVDIGLNNLDVVMGVENKVVFDLVDVIEGRCRPKQALIQDIFNPTLFVMPSVHSYNHTVVTAENVKMVLSKLEDFFDYILLDCPAGIDAPFQRAIYSADEAIVVVTPHISSLRDADKVINLLSSSNIKKSYLVINRVRGDLIMSKEIMSVEQISELLKIDLLGVIPEDDEITTSLVIGNNMQGKSPSSYAYKLIAENLHNGSQNIYDCTCRYRGLWGFFRKNIRRRV